MSVECSVFGCPSNEQTKSMFRYELGDETLPTSWHEILRGRKIENFITICEDHYLPSDIVVGSNGWKERLPGSKPSILKINLESCRFCMRLINEKNAGSSINNSVRSAFYELLDVGVENDENLPDNCCQKCLKDLKFAAATKRKFAQNQLDLRKLLSLIREKNEAPMKTEGREIKTEVDDYDDSYDHFTDDFLDVSINQNYESDTDKRQENDDPIVSESQNPSILEIVKLKKRSIDGEEMMQPPKKYRKKNRIETDGSPKKRGRKPKTSFNLNEIKLESEINEFKKIKIKAERVRSGMPREMHPCNFCAKQFCSAVAAKNHTERVHFRIRKIICDLCGFKNFTKSDLIRHMSTKHVHIDFREKFPCTICEKEFLDKTTLSSHFRFVHLNEVHGVCEYCGTAFQSNYKYAEHMRVKHTKDKPYKCKECPYVCATARDFYYHRASAHMKETLVCKFCGKHFNNKKTMESHIRMNHREKKYACDFEGCQMRFSVLNLLKKHMNSHLKLKLYQCNECLNRYSSYTHAYVHVVSSHIKFNYACIVPGCNIFYHRKDFLQSHIRVSHAYLGDEQISEIMEKIRNIKVDLNGYTITKLE